MRKTGTLADAATLAEARGRIDWRAVEVEVNPPRARLMKPGMQLDMGGIAKGYAAQEAGRVLESRGLKRCLVALAGDVYAGEAPTGQEGWRIEVRGDKTEQAVGTLVVSHASVSTSGDAEQYVEVGGVRYSHILDPRTGIGTVGGLIVTAIGSDGAYVDAADTASVVLGLQGMRAAFGSDNRVTLIVHHGGQAPVIVGDASRVRWAKPASE
jgi:thiamine biosynthesis lipoprotein